MVSEASTCVRRPGEAGFSLLELLIASTISVAIMGSMVIVTGQLQRSFYSQLDGAAVQEEGRFALDWIVRTLMTAGNNSAPTLITVSACPAAGTTFRAIQRNPNAAAVQNNIRIHSDLNGNGLLGGATTGVSTCIEAGEDITISLNTATNVIQKQDNNTEATIVDMTDSVITGLTFEYLDCSRAATASDAAVCFVRVTVTSRTPTINNNTGQQTSYTESAEVRVRTR